MGSTFRFTSIAARPISYFEDAAAAHNPFRDGVAGIPYTLDANGCVWPSEVPGLGAEVDDAFVDAHPLINGPCYV